MKILKYILIVIGVLSGLNSQASPEIFVNQVAFDSNSSKIAVIGLDEKLTHKSVFNLVNTVTNQNVFTGVLSGPMQVDDWTPGKFYYTADFSSIQTRGRYKITISIANAPYNSAEFVIDNNALAKLTIPAIIHYYHNQRANTPAELAADSKV
ncbi:cellulase N-terminal Ig-like domain-containing protein, partial [Mucilaginibacter polytrichastri]